MQAQEWADSTIAMSIYNIVAKLGRPLGNIDEILDVVRKLYHPGLLKKDAKRAVAELKKRKLLIKVKGGLDVADVQRRLVVGRNREDAEIQEDGTVTGGWKDWQVEDLLRGIIPMETGHGVL
jgi:hypothetical protein